MNSRQNFLTALAFVFTFIGLQVAAQFLVVLGKAVTTHQWTPALNGLEIVISMALFSLATIALFGLCKWTPASRRYLLSRPWPVLAWSAVAALGAVVPSMAVQELMPAWPDQIEQYIKGIEDTMMQVISTKGGYAIMCLLAPVAEEMVFRGAVLRKLLQWKPRHHWWMIALSALLFALTHMNPEQFIHPLVIGMLLGWMYYRTGSIVPGIIYHWVNNTAAYLMAKVYPNPDITLTDILGSTSHVVMAVAFSLLIIVPAVFQLHLHMRRPDGNGPK